MEQQSVDFFDYPDPTLLCPISRAVVTRNTKTLRAILRKRKKYPKPLTSDNNRRTALHVAAASEKCTELLDLLLEHGETVMIDLNFQTYDGKTALFIACENNCEENVTLLLQKGCNPMIKTLDRSSPLHIASAKGNPKIIELLLKYGAKINVRDWQNFTPLHLAAMNGHLDACRVLLDHEANAQTDSDGNLPLHLACQNGYFDVIRLLVQQDNSTINHKNFDGISPLMLAVQHSDIDGIKYMLDQGADTNTSDLRLVIPLHFAITGGNREVVELILKNTTIDCIKRFCWHEFPQVFRRRGKFFSIVCCALDSGSVDVLESILESALPREVIVAPFVTNNITVEVYTPLTYLFYYCCRTIANFNSLLNLLLKHDVIYIHEFVSSLKIDWPTSTRFINLFGDIFDCNISPDDSRFKYFQILDEHNVTPDYYLKCYIDLHIKDKELIIDDVDYFQFYKPAITSCIEGDVEVVKLFLSHSVLLEPDLLRDNVIRYLADHPESNNDKLNTVLHYLSELKPSKNNFNSICLKSLCRDSVRKQLRGFTVVNALDNFKERVNQLFLPHSLKNYILFRS